MPNRPDLAALLADPTRATEVSISEVPALLDAVTRDAARLDVLKAVLAVRLATPVSAPTNGRADEPDVIEDVRDVARITRHSVSWVRKQGHTLPGFRQPGGKGTRVGWSRRALEEWATRPTS
jgi:hypothetical protein